MQNFKLMLLALLMAIILFFVVRSESLATSSPSTKTEVKSEDKPDGKKLYTSKCIRCHNADPTKPGSVGPDIAGSSLELVTLKTQKRQYPKGYTPKRKTKIMPIIKLTEKEIAAIQKYLASFKKGK